MTEVELKSFLSDENFNMEEVAHRYPNAKRILTTGLFICHVGLDFNKIRKDVVYPTISNRFFDGYFLHNKKSGGSEDYKQLVRAALHWCNKFMVVVSSNSVEHPWVRAETAWAIHNNESIILCLLDNSDPTVLNTLLAPMPAHQNGNKEVFLVDFRINKTQGQNQLSIILDKLLQKKPYIRNFEL